MKQRYYILSAIAAAACLTACSDEAIVTPETDQNVSAGEYIQVGAVAGGEDSRVSITDEISQFSYKWEEDDTFTVFAQNTTGFSQTTFKINDGEAGSNVATFTSVDKTSFKEGTTLYALYNGNQPVVWDKDGNITLDISDQNGTLTDKYQYMLGETTYDADGNTSFRMKHLVSTLKINVTLPDGVSSLSSIQIGQPFNYFNWSSQFQPTSKATLVMKGAPYDSEGQFSTGDLVSNMNHRDGYDGTLKINGTFTPDQGNVVTLYIYMLPTQNYRDNSNYSSNTTVSSTLLVTDASGKEYAGTVICNYRDLSSDVAYEINTGLYQLEDFENEALADGSQTKPYEIANVRQFYTYMFRSSIFSIDKKTGYPYNERNYFLSSDMEFNNEMPWAPCYIRNTEYVNGRYLDVTFDGRNHAITGNITMMGPLFDEVSRSTLKNLVFNANRVQTMNYYYSPCPVFVNSVNNTSTIEHCINKSDIVFDQTVPSCPVIADYVRNSRIIACGNEGTIKGQSPQYGLLVGRMYYSTINGCYDAGAHKVGNQNSYYGGTRNIGGLLGEMNSDYYTPSSISNCWTNCDVEFVGNGSNFELNVFGLTSTDDIYSNIVNCYWNGANAASASGTNFGNYVNCATFDGNVPTAAQIKAMNDELIYIGYEFDAQGRIVQVNKSVIKPSDIEDWNK